MNYDATTLNQFPVFRHNEEICNILKESKSRCIVVTAETGAGKSTVLPLGLLNNFDGKIIMTEPRRLSVLGTAGRISDLIGEECGQTCGYKIRLESKFSKDTRLQVVTEAILVRMLQEDFMLDNFNVVVLDEFHERSIHLDLISMFLKEALELRDDLFVVIMSATMDAKRISTYFNDAPIVDVEGRTFPVNIEYKPNVGIESAVVQAYNQIKEGNILVFLPGIHEIRKCFENLKAYFDNQTEILMLHSSISLDEQKKILKSNGDTRRIIISSAIAETSLTVPDVTCVIDSGLCRMKIFNAASGMEKLVTLNESEFSAVQRSGRAGRTRDGNCFRLWSKSDIRQKEVLPDILRVDLSSVILECAERGEVSLEKLNFLDKPSDVHWNERMFYLSKSGMIKDHIITLKGKSVLKLGIDVRLASLVLAAKGNPLLLDYVRKIYLDDKNNSEREWKDILDRLEKSDYVHDKVIKERSMLLLEGFADRLALRVSKPGEVKSEYQFTNGRKAFLHKSLKISAQWIIALDVDAGNTAALIFRAEEMEGSQFNHWLDANVEIIDECYFKDGKVFKEEQTVLGKLVLSSKKLVPESSDIIPALKNEVLKKGFDAFPLDEQCNKFLLRVDYYRQQKGEPAKIKKELSSSIEEWLAPFMSAVKNLDSKTIYDALYWYLNGTEIDKEVPSVLEFSNGKKFKVTYEKNEKIRPVVEVIIQRVFGCFSTPKVMGQNVLLKLLSPASRPLQITEDLENFWTTSWPEICKEMKGRYPKHNWDYRVVEN